MRCDNLIPWRAAAAARGFNAQNLANTAWAFATLGQSDEKLFAALARAAELRMSELDALSKLEAKVDSLMAQETK